MSAFRLAPSLSGPAPLPPAAAAHSTGPPHPTCSLFVSLPFVLGSFRRVGIGYSAGRWLEGGSRDGPRAGKLAGACHLSDSSSHHLLCRELPLGVCPCRIHPLALPAHHRRSGSPVSAKKKLRILFFSLPLATDSAVILVQNQPPFTNLKNLGGNNCEDLSILFDDGYKDANLAEIVSCAVVGVAGVDLNVAAVH
ncbi:hypothetical protein GUJ93_ZPchr0001g31193 [Zizania palustris]|uniref:Uncharacterized protein n=1 Tax=Zizania palustris TaxID=103762 RepID=A0A8J5VTV5_ZIZPA|nr:hypothetical protein GUJ93_ZPchr0001g31193 [Zizania palustris]